MRALERKADSIVVRRRGKLFVLNKSDRRQKARQG
ncbi:ribosomal protein bL36 [Micromonospora sp. BRA006-A]|nr:ribosomal protein bL36 [Micromonospora sp. BRA006-A]